MGWPAEVAALWTSGTKESREDRAAIARCEAPAAAKDMAEARPMPLEAPVMRMDLPLWELGELGEPEADIKG